jgi:hypothetical protein
MRLGSWFEHVKGEGILVTYSVPGWSCISDVLEALSTGHKGLYVDRVDEGFLLEK